MRVWNRHHRIVDVAQERVGALIDTLSTDGDRLWPVDAWPPMRFDRPLGVGATGGHGPVRYHVESYEPGKSVRFRFTAPRGFDGFHEFTLRATENGRTELGHLMVLRLRHPAWLTYPLLWRPMHDALLEDCLDRAERELTGTVERPARWSLYVRLLRNLISGKRPFRLSTNKVPPMSTTAIR
ncbi:SRPBCC family protein [Amycolatopsis keratiniphila]|uniref:SRPBCC family protein n=1 Tax=Amycolatopsis keratiniphila TaxID=129921 RepID=UPI00190F810D|nr:SRPBCC family protein [Amycolatopsis keratiniphila]